MVEIENGILLKYEDDGSESYAVPDGVTEIGDNAFFGARGLKKISFPASLKKIGDDAFLWSGLTEVHIPASVEEIGNGAFQGCKELEKVTFEKGLRVIDRDAFNQCIKLKEVILPDGLKTIEAAAFRSCDELTSAVVGEGTEKLGNGAFLDCKKLKSLVLPSTLSEIEPAAFSNCVSLSTVQLDANNPYFTVSDGMLFDKYMKKLVYCPVRNESAVIPEGVEEICSFALCGCYLLKTVELPVSLKKIGGSAFRSTSGLKDIFLNDSIEFGVDPEFCKDTCIHVKSRLGEITFFPRETPMNECFILVLDRDYGISFDHKIKYSLIFRMYFAGIEGAAEYVKKNFAKMFGSLIDNSDADTVRKVLDMKEMVTKRNVKRLIEKSEYCKPIHDMLVAYAEEL